MIDIKNVNKSYPNGVHALNNVSLYIEDGEFIYIIGSTGSGKSTMIKLLNGEEVPDGGKVYVNGTDVGALKHKDVPYYRRNIGCVFQDYRLLPTLTVQENIAFALEVLGWSKNDIRKRVREVLELVDLKAKARAYPDELSGGQQQRVTIGRAIANHPKVLIADEPTGNLDSANSREVIALLKEASTKYEQTIIMITHNMNISRSADRILNVSDGVVTDLGRCRE
jgi:cell division transport system ATP-binding protein